MSDWYMSAISPYHRCIYNIIMDIIKRGCKVCPLAPCVPKKRHTWECRKALELHYKMPGAKEIWEIKDAKMRKQNDLR